MEIYILRHAIAVPRGTVVYPNDDRPLTEKGIKKMMKGARGILQTVSKFDLILSSPLKRALHTATITAEALGSIKKIRTSKNLLPGANCEKLFAELSKEKNLKRVLLVGHEPDLGILASTLIGSKTTTVEFKKGALCRIDIDRLPPVRPGRLIWYLAPKQLRTLAEK